MARKSQYQKMKPILDASANDRRASAPPPIFLCGVQEDRRAFRNGSAMFAWQREIEEYLFHRVRIANIALVRICQCLLLLGRMTHLLNRTLP
jgi:hypothetical protein